MRRISMNSRNHRFPFFVACAGVALASIQTLSAATFKEGRDAGPLLSAPKVVPAGVNRITGTVRTPGDADLYCFMVPSAGTVTIRMAALTVDSNLLLFDEEGHALFGDDDSWTEGPNTNDYDSEIQLALSPGLYYLGCGANNTEAYDNPTEFQAKSSNYFYSNDDGDNGGPTMEVLFGVASSDTSESGPYTITFSFSTGGVPVDAGAGSAKNPRSHQSRETITKSAAQITGYLSAKNKSAKDGPVTAKIAGISKSKFDWTAFDVTGKKRNVTAEMKSGKTSLVGGRKSQVFQIRVRKRVTGPATANVKLLVDSKGSQSATCSMVFE